MIANAQMDNERASNTYQIQLLKDKVEEVDEMHAQLQREHKDKCREFETMKRINEKLMEDLKLVQGQLNERDTLITNEGLTIVTIENDDGTDAKRALVSNENAQLLDAHQGSLGMCFVCSVHAINLLFRAYQARVLFFFAPLREIGRYLANYFFYYHLMKIGLVVIISIICIILLSLLF